MWTEPGLAVGAISSARCNGELTGKVMLCEAPMRVIATLTGDAVQLGNGRRAVGAILSARCNGELTQSSVTYGTRDTKRGDRVLR